MGWFWADTDVTRPSHAYTTNTSPPPGCPMHTSSSSLPSPPIPPVLHPASNLSSNSSCPYTPPTSSSSSTSTSPQQSLLSKLNPLNLMPSHIPNHPLDSSSSTITLPQSRENSTIPRGDGTGTNWEYPSPQQMYNAMLKKGYDDTPAADVPAMVAVHNFLNEGAWGEILGWERRFAKGLGRGWSICRYGEENGEVNLEMMDRKERLERGTSQDEEEQPALVRFMGRPEDLTPKARMAGWMGKVWPDAYGSELPFDRHDWFVRRIKGNGEKEEVRYVIDYYSGQPEETGEPVFYLDVRPAVDGPRSAAERLMRWGGDVWWRASGGSARANNEVVD